jgi:hypothetical protein
MPVIYNGIWLRRGFSWIGCREVTGLFHRNYIIESVFHETTTSCLGLCKRSGRKSTSLTQHFAISRLRRCTTARGGNRDKIEHFDEKTSGFNRRLFREIEFWTQPLKFHGIRFGFLGVMDLLFFIRVKLHLFGGAGKIFRRRVGNGR